MKDTRLLQLDYYLDMSCLFHSMLVQTQKVRKLYQRQHPMANELLTIDVKYISTVISQFKKYVNKTTFIIRVGFRGKQSMLKHTCFFTDKSNSNKKLLISCHVMGLNNTKLRRKG